MAEEISADVEPMEDVNMIGCMFVYANDTVLIAEYLTPLVGEIRMVVNYDRTRALAHVFLIDQDMEDPETVVIGETEDPTIVYREGELPAILGELQWNSHVRVVRMSLEDIPERRTVRDTRG